MKVYKHFNPRYECPVCGTNDEKECIWIGIEGTKNGDGGNMEARPYHLDCIELVETDISECTHPDVVYKKISFYYKEFRELKDV